MDSPWGHKESNITEQLYLSLFFTASATWEARISYTYTYIPSLLAQSLSRVTYAIQ